MGQPIEEELDEYRERPVEEPQPPEALAAEQERLSIIDQIEARHAMINIAADLEQDVIDTIAAKVVESYNTDKDSRADWERSTAELMKLAKLDSEKKTYAGEQVANVKYPVITNAAIQFAARAYPEIIKGGDVVKAKVIGDDPGGQKAERGKRLCEHMSYQLLNDMPDWEEGVDQLLFTLPVVGCAFKKTYYSSLESQAISEMVFPDDLVVHYRAVSLEKASRVTHVIELTQNEVVERIRAGVFLDFDVEELGPPSQEDSDQIDEDTPHKFLEQHRWYDLDKDGYQEPYIVTVHYATQKLVRISARFELENVKTNDKGEIVRITPTHYFTRYLFMPSPDGSFYGMGFGSLLHSINASANTTLNQLLDAGTLSNRQSGFLGRGLQLGKGRSLQFQSGEWKVVQNTGVELRQNIVPLPTKEPSPVLFQLLGLMIDTGKELSGVTDVLSGQSPGPNVPATTTLALIEQGLQVYSAIHKRIHRSLYSEFQKIRRLNVLYLPDEEYSKVLDSPEAIRRQDYESSDLDIVPVSDPSATTNMQRIMKAKALLEMKGQGLNDEEINKRYLQALQVENIEGLIPEEQAPDPLMELEIQAKQAEIQKLMVEMEKTQTETQTELTEIKLLEAKIESEYVEQRVKEAGVAFDQTKLDLEKEQGKRDTVRVINDLKKSKSDPGQGEPGQDSELKGKTAKSNTQGPYREKGMASNNKGEE